MQYLPLSQPSCEDFSTCMVQKLQAQQSGSISTTETTQGFSQQICPPCSTYSERAASCSHCGHWPKNLQWQHNLWAGFVLYSFPGSCCLREWEAEVNSGRQTAFRLCSAGVLPLSATWPGLQLPFPPCSAASYN